MSELPRLSSAELVAQLGGDEAALRRYRMLVALLREGRSPSEVARTFGVSRESLRRLRHAFAMDGLAALRSQKRGGGHFFRRSALAIAIRQELNADPGIDAATLWRRVQERLAGDGAVAPRSTFYRLLAQLRTEDAAPSNEGVPAGLLRDALGALAEDPPLALGRSDLAALLLPDIREPLGRGRQLQQAFRSAIERLRPNEAGPVLDDSRWRHYLIIAGEYETGEKRAVLQSALALSASTYSRAKREALERLAALLPVVLSDLPPPKPDITLIAPPAPPKQIEHEPELEQYAALLRRDGLAIMWGPAAVGKRALAASLAERLQSRGQKVVWHTCRSPHDDAFPSQSLLRTLAAALALDGHNELWETLRTAEPMPASYRLELLAASLHARHWTVIIDNAHWLERDDAARILELLFACCERRDVRLVFVARSLPAWASAERWPSLPYPSDAAARQAFSGRLGRMSAPSAVPPSATHPLHDQIAEIVAAMPIDQIERMSADELAQLSAALRPLEYLVAEMNKQRAVGE